MLCSDVKVVWLDFRTLAQSKDKVNAFVVDVQTFAKSFGMQPSPGLEKAAKSFFKGGPDAALLGMFQSVWCPSASSSVEPGPKSDVAAIVDDPK